MLEVKPFIVRATLVNVPPLLPSNTPGKTNLRKEKLKNNNQFDVGCSRFRFPDVNFSNLICSIVLGIRTRRNLELKTCACVCDF